MNNHMHRQPSFLLTFVAAFCLLFFSVPSQQALSQTEPVTEVRTWTSLAGTTIEAAAIGIRQGKLGLKAPDGRIIAVPVSQFSAEDIAFLHEHFAGNPDLPPIPGQPQVSSAQTTEFSIYALGEVHGPLQAGKNSTYFIYLPKSLKKDRPAPYMLFTGAGGGNAKAVQRLIPAAERCGIIIAANVESANKNPGPTSNYDHSMNTVKAINQAFPVDPNRVYFTGNSGGGATAMVNSTYYEGSAGAMPIVAYLRHELYEKSDPQKRHFALMGGATDYNRYITANIATIHDKNSLHRFGPGGSPAATSAITARTRHWMQKGSTSRQP